jgi:dipeptidyl-peptidase 4
VAINRINYSVLNTKLESKTRMLAMLLLIKRESIQSLFVAVTSTICLIAGATVVSQDNLIPSGLKTDSASAIKSLLTVAESSNYLATASEQEVLDFLKGLDDASPFASQLRIGSTIEARPIQALLVAKEPNVQLPLAPSDERLVIVLLGGIHSGESDGKEALLALTRDILSDATPRYLDKAVLVFIPNFNADGNERVGTLHRPGQEGPVRGMGTRENAIGLDLNRDFIKLDSPEVRALVRMLDTWDADVLIDTHTTNGSLHQYDLTYDIPHNPAANQNLVQWMRKEMLPKITSDLATQGFPTFYYGNFSNDQKRWESFGHEPRYSTEYMGLRGKIGILVESYSYASYQRRIDASYLFVDACLKQLTDNAKRLKTQLDQKPGSAPKSVALQAKIVADELPAIAKGFSWAKKTAQSKVGDAVVEEDDDHEHGATGDSNKSGFPSPKDRKRKSELVATDFEVQLLNVGSPTLTVNAPEFYFVPADNAWAAGRLRMHGIRMSWLDAATAANMGITTASQYRIATKSDQPEFQKHAMRKVAVTSESIQWRPASGWIVSTKQTLGVVATYLLEPHSDDSLAVWNFFDPGLQTNAIYPVLRIDGVLSLPAELKPLGMLESPASGFTKEELTLEKIYNPAKKVSLAAPPSETPKWLPNQDAYLMQHNGRWHSVDCLTGAMQPFDRPKRLTDALAKLEAFNDSQASSVGRRLEHFDAKFENALIEHKGDIYVFQTGGYSGIGAYLDTVRQITHSPDQAKELAEMSPTGKHVAYIHNNNIWVADCGTTEVRKLTDDNDPEVLNGKLDWVYQEEIYGRGKFKGYWWSPDGSMIAFLRLDETLVPRFRIDNSLMFAQTLEETRYPKSGQPNPNVSLHVVNVATGNIQEVPLDNYAANDRLVVRVGWRPSPDNEVVFQIQNRIQSKLDVCAFDTSTKKVRTLVQETSPAWVDVIDEPRWLPDGSFLWLSDSAGGRRHLYRIGADGKSKSVTQGNWDVKSIEWVSPDGKEAVLLGHRSSPINTDVLRVDLTNNAMETVGEATGVHRISVHPIGQYYFDTYSDVKTPSQLWLRKQDGKKLRFVGGFRSDRFEYLKTGGVELFEIAARDGFKMQSMLYKPVDFAMGREKAKMPVMIHVYGGPAAPTVENSWTHRSDLWHRYMAEQGICVLLCDNRSALGRGNSDTWKIYKDMGSTELRDLEDAVQWLKQQSWVDPERIGMWGWSYGGYFTAYAMTHSKSFRAGIAGAPVTDWNNYDSVYTERYMDTPQANPEGYKSSSVVNSAKDLHGRLMLIHGEIDDNVHMANTMQLVHALQKANKKFDLMVYPNSRHGVVDPDQSYHQYQMMTDFFKDQLLGDR